MLLKIAHMIFKYVLIKQDLSMFKNIKSICAKVLYQNTSNGNCLEPKKDEYKELGCFP